MWAAHAKNNRLNAGHATGGLYCLCHFHCFCSLYLPQGSPTWYTSLNSPAYRQPEGMNAVYKSSQQGRILLNYNSGGQKSVLEFSPFNFFLVESHQICIQFACCTTTWQYKKVWVWCLVPQFLQKVVMVRGTLPQCVELWPPCSSHSFRITSGQQGAKPRHSQLGGGGFWLTLCG